MAVESIARRADRRQSIAVGVSRAQRVLRRGHQLICGIAGHSLMLAFKRDRLLLRCPDCGYESPGWEIGTRPVRPVLPRAAVARFRHSARVA
jgi:hypothetical protein